MSRQLPARPNLEHLKKQAKDLLEQLHRTNPAAQLADAQHAIAIEYGFASWPKLKVHIESQRLQARAASPLDGRWTADPTRSKQHPANPWRTATILIEVAGDDVRITDDVVDASGREERHVNTIRADGVEHLADAGNGYSLVARWRDEHTLETLGKKDGEVVGSATYQVSEDGRTLTISAEQQLIVLHRSDDTGV